MCDFINAHEDIIRITTFGEYREVMQQAMRVIKETHSIERKRRQTSRKKKSDETAARKQRAKTLIVDVKRGGMRKKEIARRLEDNFGK